MFAEVFCRGWNSIRVRFWSIGFKKRLFLQFGIVLSIGLGGFLLWTTLFANLADLEITQKEHGNDSTIWDKWVRENGLKSIGDIWDDCGKFTLEIRYCISDLSQNVKGTFEFFLIRK